MSQYDFRFERGSDGVAVLTLDRPATLNSLTFAIYGQLERLFAELEDDESVKVVVLTATPRVLAAAAAWKRSSARCSRANSTRRSRSRA